MGFHCTVDGFRISLWTCLMLLRHMNGMLVGLAFTFENYSEFSWYFSFFKIDRPVCYSKYHIISYGRMKEEFFSTSLSTQHEFSSSRFMNKEILISRSRCHSKVSDVWWFFSAIITNSIYFSDGQTRYSNVSKEKTEIGATEYSTQVSLHYAYLSYPAIILRLRSTNTTFFLSDA